MEEKTITLSSSHDGSSQPVRYITAGGRNRPLLVALHTWSFDYTQDTGGEYFSRASAYDWNCVFPNFRGPNRNPAACGSPAALADICDAVNWASAHLPVDHRRVFIAGESGGGHMTLLAAGAMPSLWTAASAWVPISDLARWHRECTERKLPYTTDMEASCGGAPGTSETVDREYHSRSPISSLWRAHIIPMDINAGIHDGHGGSFGGQGSVPVGQSVRAYNELVRASGKDLEAVSEDLIEHFETKELVPSWCDPGATTDPDYDRPVLFRRTAGLARLTLFEGGHEVLRDTVFKWFAKF